LEVLYSVAVLRSNSRFEESEDWLKSLLILSGPFVISALIFVDE